jgi:hypothetical protein
MLSITGTSEVRWGVRRGADDPRDVVETTCDDVGEKANSRANNSVSSFPRSSRRVSCPSEDTTDELQKCDKLGSPETGQDDSGAPYGSEGWGFESLRARDKPQAVIGAPDAHAKNYALLLSGRQVRLAPFFDIASALAYPDFYGSKIKLAMRIGGYYRLSSIDRHAWERLAAELRLDKDLLIVRARELSERLPDVFSTVCADPVIVALDSALPHRLLDQVAARSRSCLADLEI